jgi:hypothetical protein
LPEKSTAANMQDFTRNLTIGNDQKHYLPKPLLIKKPTLMNKNEIDS